MLYLVLYSLLVYALSLMPLFLNSKLNYILKVKNLTNLTAFKSTL